MGSFCIPQQSAHTEHHVILNNGHAISFEQHKLIWSARDSGDKDLEARKGEEDDGGADQPIGDTNGSGTLHEHEILFICRESSSQSDGPSDTQSTADATGYIIYSVHEDAEKNHEQPYRLSSLSAPRLPQSLLDTFLLDEPPAHLVGAEDLQVIISTKSGTGLAKAFYESVLSKLLTVFGLRAHDDHSITSTESTGSNVAGPSYQLFVTRSRHSIRELAQERWSTQALVKAAQARPSSRQLLVLLSGDGGLVDLLNGAGEPDDAAGSSSVAPPAIALLPLGTGNALFHSLHKPLYKNTPETSEPSHLLIGLRTLFRGEEAPLPTFRASFSPGSFLVPPAPEDDEEKGQSQEQTISGENQTEAAAILVDHLLGAIVASHGFHAQLVWESDTAAYRQHGAKRFGMAAAELLKTAHAYQVVVDVRSEADDSEWMRIHPTLPKDPTGDSINESRERFMYVLSTLVSNLEKTFTISPESRPLDGQLRLISFGAVGAEKTLELMQAAYNGGKHVDCTWSSSDNTVEDTQTGNDKVVGYNKVEEFKITIQEEDPRWRKVCIDGTIVEIPQGGWMHVRKTGKSRFRVLVDKSVL
ncbi:hypothetical protein MCOR25_006995 [Pyricularia grisea]|uniref:DAGKc domain-containing protein n=1 Tax=Pyricularia grisea TaxID=148305 RepID=A0A6P8BBS8_PYRGI|nr:uncharacterized protein PgNI_04069 [Pyricularia grisea]KAI6359670.1 hypothetical protein MCOR25_006995 [Pyricularia grisea]TLD13285.1 hypothetical protein PgNI_04069 [Pyricularia grisea]